MKTYLEFKDEKSDKFWEITLTKNELTTRYGKIGTQGNSKIKSFETHEEALKAAQKLIAQKKGKGYVELACETHTQEPQNVALNLDFFNQLKINSSLYFIKEDDDNLLNSSVFSCLKIYNENQKAEQFYYKDSTLIDLFTCEHKVSKDIETIIIFSKQYLDNGYKLIFEAEFNEIVNKLKRSILIPSANLALTNFELCLIYKFKTVKEFKSFDFWLDYKGYILETTDQETLTFQEESRKFFDSPEQMLEEVVSICEEKIQNGFNVIVGANRTQFEKEQNALQKQWKKSEKPATKQLKENKKLLKTYIKDNNRLKPLFKEIEWDDLKTIRLED